ncbi:MAG TPA: hypothetical protein VG899_12360 [Mycobacteriales bacterium]|nr:hypothetical protein [Mycobacteriales bacterium]
MADHFKIILGYGPVAGIPRCPCNDPGNHVAVEQSTTDPLDLLIRCWCGRTMRARADNEQEITDLIATRRTA